MFSLDKNKTKTCCTTRGERLFSIAINVQSLLNHIWAVKRTRSCWLANTTNSLMFVPIFSRRKKSRLLQSLEKKTFWRSQGTAHFFTFFCLVLYFSAYQLSQKQGQAISQNIKGPFYEVFWYCENKFSTKNRQFFQEPPTMIYPNFCSP